MDRATAWRIMASAEALDRRTRAKGQHGGVLKAKGLDVLRALLRRFYSYATGECFPSYDEIAEAAGCSRSTVATKLRLLELYGFISTIRRKVVASFTSRAHRFRFDVAVQTSNSYTFNMPIGDRAQHGDAALPLLKPVRKAEFKIQAETSTEIKNKDDDDLKAVKAHWIAALLGTDRGG